MFAERILFSCIGAFGLAAGAFCQTYVQISVDEATSPNSINKKGKIAGSYIGAGGFHGFVRDPNGPITIFDPPGSSDTAASSINDAGAITGSFTDTAGRGHGFVRNPEGHITTFDAPGSTSTSAGSINAGGTVTGSYNDANGVSHGFVRRADGKLTSFDPPGRGVEARRSARANLRVAHMAPVKSGSSPGCATAPSVTAQATKA